MSDLLSNNYGAQSVASLTPLTGSDYAEVETIKAKVGDEFWDDKLKRWISIEVRGQQIGVQCGGYLVRRKIRKPSSPNTDSTTV